MLAVRVLLPIANIRWLASWSFRYLYRFVITTCLTFSSIRFFTRKLQ